MASEKAQKINKVRRKRGETRLAILEAVMRLLMKEGPDAISTTRLAKEVGIVQSGFYAHFKTIEECVRAVVDEIDINVRQPLADSMAQLRLTDAGDVLLLEPLFIDLFDTVEANWPFMQLFMHYRGDHSLVGRLVAEFELSLVNDLRLHLRALNDVETLQPVFDNVSDDAVIVLSNLMISQSLVGIMQWQKGLISKQMLARFLAEQTAHMGQSIEAAQQRELELKSQD